MGRFHKGKSRGKPAKGKTKGKKKSSHLSDQYYRDSEHRVGAEHEVLVAAGGRKRQRRDGPQGAPGKRARGPGGAGAPGSAVGLHGGRGESDESDDDDGDGQTAYDRLLGALGGAGAVADMEDESDGAADDEDLEDFDGDQEMELTAEEAAALAEKEGIELVPADEVEDMESDDQEEEEESGDEAAEEADEDEDEDAAIDDNEEDDPEMEDANLALESLVEAADLEAEEVEEEHVTDPYQVHVQVGDGEAPPKEATVAKFESVKHPVLRKVGDLQVAAARGVHTTGKVCPPVEQSLRDYKIKSRLADRLDETGQTWTALQRSLLSMALNYVDVHFAGQTFGNTEDLRRVYLVHVLNHVLKIRDRVLKNTAKINHAKRERAEVPEFRDSHFTRASVLILAPFRSSVKRIMDLLLELAPRVQVKHVLNKERFKTEFGGGDDDDDNDGKPEDYRQLFAGNVDDFFRLGIAVTRGAIRLFSNFYSSDIIIASPLALRARIGAEGDKGGDSDFLSSIEVVVIDQADVMLQQNWDHVVSVLEAINRTPRNPHGADFSRIIESTLDGWLPHFRQTLMFSAFPMPDFNALLKHQCHNRDGKIRITPQSYEGSITNVGVSVRQVFQKISAESPGELDDARFDYFVRHVVPLIADADEGSRQIVVFVSSYFDYVRLRNYFHGNDYNTGTLSEYTKLPLVRRHRTLFQQGRLDVMLYTERLHYFRRYHIRATKSLVFYSLPVNAQFYPELVNWLSSAHGSCLVLYSPLEAMLLARVVGSDRARKMLESEKPTHMFV